MSESAWWRAGVFVALLIISTLVLVGYRAAQVADATLTVIALASTAEGGELPDDVMGLPHRLFLPAILTAADDGGHEPPREWDPVLDELGVTLEAADVGAGEAYWRIVAVQWWDEQEGGGRHHIDVDMRDESGARVLGAESRVWWDSGDVVLIQEDKPAPEFGANFPMYRAVSGCPYGLEALGLPSDRLHCLGLGTPEEPWRTIHTVFRVVYQRSVRGAPIR